MNEREPLLDRVQRVATTHGDEMFHEFANGLKLKTEVFFKSDTQRILPLGSPQGCLMNHMLHFPGCVKGKRVFEPFAGSGPLGFMALQLGAAHADFLDINPRAVEFQLYNGRQNGFDESRFTAYEGDIASFRPGEKYDVIFANPPFVPTPTGLDGSLTSAGGSEGNRFVSILLERLDELLSPDGRAYVYLLQFAQGEIPLVSDLLDQFLRNRAASISPAQSSMVPLELFVGAYRRIFADSGREIEAWNERLINRHGSGLRLCHYVVDIGPRGEEAASWVLHDDFLEKFGADFLVPSENLEELAFSRAFENLVPEPTTPRGRVN